MKKIFAPDQVIFDLAEKYPTPFYLYDEAGIRRTARAVKAAFGWNPGYRQFFAVKATPNPTILKILKEEGIFAECSSAPEIGLAKMAGYQGEDILFAPNFPPEADVLAAAEAGCRVNLDGLELVEYFHQRGALKGSVGLRYNPGGEFFIDGKKISNPGSTKFGLTRPQLTEAAKKLKALGIQSFGIQGYMGGNIQEQDYYDVLSRMLMTVAVEVSRESGLKLDYVNLSGGIGVGYRPEEKTPDISAVGQAVKRNFEDILVPAGMGDVAIFTELGRFMTAPHGILISRVIHMKQGHKAFVGLDASAHNLMRPMMYGAYHHISIVGKEHEPHDHIYDVVGSVCEGIDRFAQDRPLPQVQVGDLAVIHDCGAHGHSMGYNYGGKLRSAELLLRENGQVDIIRRAETLEDYLATVK